MVCNVSFQVPVDMTQPVYLMYALGKDGVIQVISIRIIEGTFKVRIIINLQEMKLRRVKRKVVILLFIIRIWVLRQVGMEVS